MHEQFKEQLSSTKDGSHFHAMRSCLILVQTLMSFFVTFIIIV